MPIFTTLTAPNNIGFFSMLDHFSVNTCTFSLNRLMRVDNISITKLFQLQNYLILVYLFELFIVIEHVACSEKIVKVFFVKTRSKKSTFEYCNLRTVRVCRAKQLKTSCEVRFMEMQPVHQLFIIVTELYSSSLLYTLDILYYKCNPSRA